jgi:hypothetical protein
VQHVYALRVRLYADLMDGKAHDAWRMLIEAWPRLRDGMHLAIRTSRIDFELLRGRLALACAQDCAPSTTDFIGEALRSADRLEATKRPDADCHAQLLRATVAALRGDHRASRSALQSAARAYAALGMDAYAASAAARAAELAADASAHRETISVLQSLGIRDYAGWLRFNVPGFRPRA